MAKKTTTAKTASTKAKAVMDSRNPKKPMAISGNTMNSESMYRKGGKTKYATGGKFPDLTGDGKVTKADILKGRGVIKKSGGSTAKYQGGGAMDAAMNKIGAVGKRIMESPAGPYVGKAASTALTGIEKVGNAVKNANLPSAKKAMDTLSKNRKPVGGYKKGGSTKSKSK